jgi:hypothetical protein
VGSTSGERRGGKQEWADRVEWGKRAVGKKAQWTCPTPWGVVELKCSFVDGQKWQSFFNPV